MKRIVIIGGVAAGSKAAATARRRDPSLEIVIIQDEPAIAYSACGMPYHLADPGIIPRPRLIARTPEQFRGDGIDVRTGHRAIAVDPERKTALIRDGDGEEYHQPFDDLLFATGAAPIMPAIPVEDGGPPVLPLRSLRDLDRLMERVVDLRRVLIVGGGYIGLEMAESLRHRGVNVTLVEKLPRLLPSMSPLIGDMIVAELQAAGVNIHTGRGLAQVVAAGGILESGEIIPADLVLLAIGVRPQVELAVRAGVALGSTGAIAVDAKMRTNVPSLHAAGDCAETRHLVSGKPVWIPLGDVANRQGRIAGINMAGGDVNFPGVLGTAIFKTFDLAIGRTGLTARQAEEAGFSPVEVEITAPSRARYMPSSRPLTVTLVADVATGRVLGAEAVGVDAVDKYIDTVAACLWGHLTVDDMADLDLAYAPPFAPVSAPVQVVAEAAKKAIASASRDRRGVA